MIHISLPVIYLEKGGPKGEMAKATRMMWMDTVRTV